MTYPMVLLVMCVAVVILIVTFILPQFQSLFDQLDELPAMTQMLVNLSDFLVTKWYLAIILVCLAGDVSENSYRDSSGAKNSGLSQSPYLGIWETV